jgi:hypothetical protein
LSKERQAIFFAKPNVGGSFCPQDTTQKIKYMVSFNYKWVSYLNNGSFEDLELAELVAIEARNKYHGDFARHK